MISKFKILVSVLVSVVLQLFCSIGVSKMFPEDHPDLITTEFVKQPMALSGLLNIKF